MTPEFGWNEERKFVLKSLEKQEEKLDDLTTNVNAFVLTQTTANAEIKFRQSVVGALTIAVPSIIAAAFWLISNWHK